MISTIGPDRVMMGADLPSNVPVEIAKYRALDLEPAVYDQVMGRTAIEVFGLRWKNDKSDLAPSESISSPLSQVSD